MSANDALRDYVRSMSEEKAQRVLNLLRRDTLIAQSMEEGAIADELHCPECGLAMLTEEEAGRFEDLFSSTMPVYVDTCRCGKEN